MPLTSFNLYSSTAGLLGSPGQAPHSATSTWVDAMAAYRLRLGMRGQSVAWGAVGEVGYAARHSVNRRAEESGFGVSSHAMTLAAIGSMLHPASRSFAVLPADWSKLLSGDRSEVRGLLAPYTHLGRCSAPPAVACVSAVMRSTVGLDAVLSLVRSIAGGVVDADAPLMEAGVDSLAAVELRNHLQPLVEATTLPSTLALDYPTARLLASSPLMNSNPGPCSVRICGVPLCQNTSHKVRADGTAALMPGGVKSIPALWHQTASWSDAVARVPATRWVDMGRPALAGLMDGADCFDNAYFGISVAEVAVADPVQRLLLEQGYAALHESCFSKAQLAGRAAGVFLGVDKCEWSHVSFSMVLKASVFSMSGASNSIAAGRIAFVLGLHGPCVTMDTACSSASVATHGSVRALQLQECEPSLTLGANLILLPAMHNLFALAGLASPMGRCHVFDARADGMGRGEACSAVVLHMTPADVPCHVFQLLGSAVRQDGRSSSLTAPRGVSQQQVFHASFADAGVGAASIIWCEAHGTGTKLGDPVEAGSLRRSVLSCRETDEVLTLGSLKAVTGHTEGASGMPGLLKTACSLRLGMAPPNAHLRTVNPFVKDAFYECTTWWLPVQLCALLGVKKGAANGMTNAFGFSGTLASIVSEACALPEACEVSVLNCVSAPSCARLKAHISYRRHNFPCSSPSHPLLQQRLVQSNDLAVFHSPTAGRLHALVTEHVVQGRVVFPGAAYLETARAAWSAVASSSAAGACLHGVFFLQPLILDAGADGAAVLVECVLHEGGLFEVHSGDGAALYGHNAPTHCTGTALASVFSPQQLGGVAARRSGCAHVGCVVVQYEAFHVVGLQYGPSYRQQQQAWACEQRHDDGGWRGAMAQLQRRLGSREVVVHPADLDGALQLSAMLQPAGGNDASETRLPYVVESALLEGGAVEQWAVRAKAPTHAQRALLC